MSLPPTDALKAVAYTVSPDQARVAQGTTELVARAVRLVLLTRINPSDGAGGPGQPNGGPGQALDLFA